MATASVELALVVLVMIHSCRITVFEGNSELLRVLPLALVEILSGEAITNTSLLGC